MMKQPSHDRLRNLADFLLPVLLVVAILVATSLFVYARLDDALREAETHVGAIHLVQGRLDEGLGAILLVIALALALAVMMANRLAAKRLLLADAVRRLARDDLEAEHYTALARLGTKRNDRLGELARALLELRETRIAQNDNEALLKAVIEEAPCAIELVDPVTLRFLQVNAYSRQTLGFTEAELRARGVADIQAELPPEQLQALTREILLKRRVEFETVHRAADGRRFAVSVRVCAIHQHGRDYLLGIWQDVSAEREAAQALKKYSMAIEQSPNAVIITDTEARIEYVNDAFAHTSGYTRAEVVGRNPRLLQSGKTPAAVYADMWATLLRGEPWRGELINRRKDGGEYIELAHIAPIRQPDGRITHYLAIKQDISEKRRLIEELERHRHHLEQLVAERSAELLAARDAAEVANRAKSEFLANMSHEIRTPLNAIIGLGHLLARDLQADDHKARLGKITAAARHLLQIINDILDLSKIEAGRLDLEANDFDPAVMLAGTLELVREQAEQKGLQLVLALDSLPPRVRGDALRLGQIVLNFASNAVKFTAHGTIAIRGHVLSATGEQLIVRFEVADTGIGMDPGQCERVFQPFEQADPSTTRKYGGTGLGLAISRRLTELMGGTIGVDSTPGEGSTFWIEVPLQARPAPGRARAIAPGSERPTSSGCRQLALDGRRILLAEDNPINREVAVALLRETGATIDTAENGQEAVEMAGAVPYDLILMDMQMPVMDGLTATRLLRSRAELRDLPIVAMTANAFSEDRQLCIDAGMNDHIPKPVEPELLCEKLVRWLPASAPGAAASAPAPAPEEAPAVPAADGAHDAGALDAGALDAGALDAGALDAGAHDAGALDAGALDALADLAAIPDLDVAEGMHYVLGDVELYRELLHLFAEGDYGRVLQRAIEAGDLEAACRTAHSIKGGAATIGARALSLAAAELESRLGAHLSEGAHFTHEALPKEAMHALAARGDRLCEALRKTASAAADRAAAEAGEGVEIVAEDPAQAAQVLADIDRLLVLGDLAVRDQLDAHRGLLRKVLGDRFARFEERIADFAFDEALADLRAALQARTPAGSDRTECPEARNP
ncbi:MAG: PAS domain S-box protein [Thauera sp.]|nr:PAS domain S-box protein [Thauera sp.]